MLFSIFFSLNENERKRKRGIRKNRERKEVSLNFLAGTNELGALKNKRSFNLTLLRVETVIAVVIPNILPARSLFLHSRLQGQEE